MSYEPERIVSGPEGTPDKTQEDVDELTRKVQGLGDGALIHDLSSDLQTIQSLFDFAKEDGFWAAEDALNFNTTYNKLRKIVIDHETKKARQLLGWKD